MPGSETGQHVPLNEYKNNLKAILEHSSVVAQKPRLILLTPPPVNEYQLERADLGWENQDPIRSAEHTKKYADACREVGAEMGVAVLDVWSIFMVSAGWKEGEALVGSKEVARNQVLEKLLTDGELPEIAVLMKAGAAEIDTGLHFRPEGYRLLFDSMMGLIHKEWPDQAPDNLSFIFRPWAEAPK